NKMDLVGDDFNLVPFHNWGNDHNMKLMKASAKTGEGVSSLFSYMAQQVSTNCTRNRQLRAETMIKDICAVDGAENEKSDCC
ncbi:MAG: hypothetical protein LBG60_00515, partial [Bifidobacteriaceae bacterium]|nr:hypothetical protein [Bifidobacteriaceae bacterium]